MRLWEARLTPHRSESVPALCTFQADDEAGAYRQAVATSVDFSRLTGAEWSVTTLTESK